HGERAEGGRHRGPDRRGIRKEQDGGTSPRCPERGARGRRGGDGGYEGARQRRAAGPNREAPGCARPLPVTTASSIVAVVPFGAKGRDTKAGGIGRQVARRLVERFADDPNVELRPVFLVAMPDTKSDAGYLVFGSTPDPDLAARYGESLGTTHALTGLYREDATGRAFAVSLVEVKSRTVAAEREIVVAPDELHRAEPALAAWLAEALGLPAPGLAPETANEPSYQAFLAGLEDETNATLLRAGHPPAPDQARARPLRDVDIVVLAELYISEQAPGQAAAHLRRIAAGSEEFGRAQELLGILALGKGDPSAARRHFERAAENGRVSARAHLARVLIADGRRDEAARELEGLLSTSGADADALAQAHRLRLGLERPDLEAELERAGRRALSAEATGLDEVRAAFERVLAFDTHIWEAYFGLGLVARRSDDFAAAAGSFRRALELAPEQADVMHELGVALLASGSRADALGLLDRAASLRPREAAYIADAGFAH